MYRERHCAILSKAFFIQPTLSLAAASLDFPTLQRTGQFRRWRGTQEQTGSSPPSVCGILTLQCQKVKAKPLLRQWWLSFFASGSESWNRQGLRPIDAGYALKSNLNFRCRKFQIRPFIRPVKIMKEIKKKNKLTENRRKLI